MADSRNLLVLGGAAAVIFALFMPWFALEIGDQARAQITQGVSQMPNGLGDFARGLVNLIPERVVANGWDVFQRADWVMLVTALAAAGGALYGRVEIVRGAAAGAVVTVLTSMFVHRGPLADYISLQWGAWLALAGAIAMAVGAVMMRAELPVPAPAALPGDWSPSPQSPRAEEWTPPRFEPEPYVVPDPSRSVAPPR